MRNCLGTPGILLDICVYMYKGTSCFPLRKGSKGKARRGDQGQGQGHCTGRCPQSWKGRTRHIPLSRSRAAGEAVKDLHGRIWETLQGCKSIGKSPAEWGSPKGQQGRKGSPGSVPTQLSVPLPGTQQCQAWFWARETECRFFSSFSTCISLVPYLWVLIYSHKPSLKYKSLCARLFFPALSCLLGLSQSRAHGQPVAAGETRGFTTHLALTKRQGSLHPRDSSPLSCSRPKGTDIPLIYAKEGQANNESRNGLFLQKLPVSWGDARLAVPKMHRALHRAAAQDSKWKAATAHT